MALFEPSFAKIGPTIRQQYFAAVSIEMHGKTPKMVFWGVNLG